MTRRSFIPALSASAVVFAQTTAPSRSGRLKQGVTKGVFKGAEMSLDEMCREAAKAGIYGFDLIDPKDWPTSKSMD